MKTKLKDIAEYTGFSINTVSRALRGKSDISEATKKIIREAAEKLEYIPNLHAGGLKSGNSKIISIILPEITNPHFTIVFREIETFFANKGITPFFMNTNENGDAEMNAVRISIGQNVDGVIICPTQTSQSPLRLLEKSRIPYVLIGRRIDDFDADYVICDDVNGAYIATEHLISLGHENIAFVKPNNRISSVSERFEGYLRALMDARIPFRENNVLNINLTSSDNQRLIADFLKQNKQCTAVLSFNDSIAYAIVHILKMQGKSVPEDVSVLGFDNICSDYVLPIPLSSVSVSKKHMAIVASELLYDLIYNREERNTEKKHIVLPTRLFLRETTGVPRK